MKLFLEELLGVSSRILEKIAVFYALVFMLLDSILYLLPNQSDSSIYAFLSFNTLTLNISISLIAVGLISFLAILLTSKNKLAPVAPGQPAPNPITIVEESSRRAAIKIIIFGIILALVCIITIKGLNEGGPGIPVSDIDFQEYSDINPPPEDFFSDDPQFESQVTPSETLVDPTTSDAKQKFE